MWRCALVGLEGDAAALKARPLRVQQTVMLTKRTREVPAAECFDLRAVEASELHGVRRPTTAPVSARLSLEQFFRISS